MLTEEGNSEWLPDPPIQRWEDQKLVEQDNIYGFLVD